MRTFARRSWVGSGVIALVLGIGISIPALASATAVTNGSFETGTLEGWSTSNENEFGGGSWFAYSGTSPLLESPSVPLPPAGTFGAITAQEGPGTHILYQDLHVDPGTNETLSMVVYYQSFAPLVSPPTLSYEEGANQQYRIDLIKPSAELESLEASDILAMPFQTVTGGPESQAYKTVSVSLAPFAGQAVRLRLAEVDNEGNFSAGVDDVKVTSPAPPAPVLPSNTFTFGKLKLNKKKGTATLKVNVPGAGKLTAADVKKKGKRVKQATATIASAGTATLILKPTGAGTKTLKKNGKLSFKLAVTFTPTGGTAASQAFSGKLKLTLKPPTPKS